MSEKVLIHALSSISATTWQPLTLNAGGGLNVGIIDSAGAGATIALPTDAFTTQGLIGYAGGMRFNGTNWDRERGNIEETILASAARTASVNSADFVNYNARGLHLILNVSALAATPSITVSIQGKDAISGTYYNILTSAAITTTGINILKLYPGISAIPSQSASDILPRTWRVAVTNADADSITYSVSAALVA